MTKKTINSKKAPASIGPYSQAVAANGFIFLSGQLPVDPETNKMNEGSMEEQTIQVIENIKTILEEVDSSLEDIVKVNIYTNDIGNYEKINGVYAGYFKEECPARCFVEVSKLPKDSSIEVEVVAVQG